MTRRPNALTAAKLPTVVAMCAAMAAGLSMTAVSAAPPAVAAPVDLSPVKGVHGRSALPDGWQHGAFI